MADANVAEDPKKPRKVLRTFLDKDGKAAARATPEAVTVSHKWLSDGHDFKMNLADLKPEIVRCAALFGISQVVGNAYGGETDDSAAQEKAEQRWETLVGGSWATERETGPRIGDLVEAFAKARADAGKPVSEEWKEKAAAQIADGTLDSKELLKNGAIKAAFDAIKLQRAQERAKKSAEAAKATPQDLPDVA